MFGCKSVKKPLGIDMKLLNTKMGAISSQHLELTNTVKGEKASNIQFDDKGNVIGMSVKIIEDDSTSVIKLIDTIWEKYDDDGNGTINQIEARMFI